MIRKIARRRPMSSLDGGGLPPLLQRIYENRNVRARSELDYSLKRLQPPEQLKGCDAAAALLQKALENNWKILVIGDYDADGATGAALALLALRAFGAQHVAYQVPNRFEDGYGLSPKIAEAALARAPNLVITVDNGISSMDGVARLRAAGVAVIVTDHHLAGARLPEADAIVNPNQPGCEFPSKALSGAGVMFYLLLALRARLRAENWFARAGRDAPNLAEYLDLVAVGTVADLVPLDANNRILVAQGISRIRAGRCRPGIRALLEIAGRNCAQADSRALGFLVAPRINAAGRLDDISTGIECLLAEDAAGAHEYARALHAMNRERRGIEQTMQRQAMKTIADLERGGESRDGFCLFERGWHQGVVGLVASRVRERFERPAVAFAPGEDGKLRGSARSVDGLHIRDLLEAISAREPGLVEKFGGHAMAAGLTIAPENFDAFARHFHELAAAHFAEHAPCDEILTDGPLAEEDFTLDNAELMRSASPWGQHFPPPLFDGHFRVTAQRVVGEHHLKMQLTLPDGARALEAIAFGQAEPGREAAKQGTVQAAYELQVNEYRGARTLQLLVKHMQPADARAGG
ncbi:MAG: single-stranded-DNA-specific exonuclease RecJ [Gammaproteobacteria bacterium]|nr:single-stranded-DNA-specific exonuclease RecJ [Gammaproteobacteria bacterium]